MGSGSAKEEQELAEDVAEIRRKFNGDFISAQEARDQLSKISTRLESGAVKLSEEGLKVVRGKIDDLDRLIAAEIESERRETELKDAQRKLDEDADAQLAESRLTGNLVPLYSTEFGTTSPVAALLKAGRNNGGYRNPKLGLDLEPIKTQVVDKACEGGGFSSSKSTANGLVNRIRDMAYQVVNRAYAAGYDVENANVQTAMGTLAREVAFTLSSDSGGRSETKENRARGMGYTDMKDLSDSSALQGEYIENPKELLKKAELGLQAVVARLDTATDPQLLERLRKQKAELQRRIKELSAQV